MRILEGQRLPVAFGLGEGTTIAAVLFGLAKDAFDKILLRIRWLGSPVLCFRAIFYPVPGLTTPGAFASGHQL